MKIKVKKLKENAKLPSYAHPGDVGMDLFAMETVTLGPGEHVRLWHGFALEFPEGYAAIVMDKSSISKAGLLHMGGVFDAGYRGEYNTHLVNLSTEPYTLEEGDKVSQLVIVPVSIVELEEVTELSDSSRGVGAFGSTGKKYLKNMKEEIKNLIKKSLKNLNIEAENIFLEHPADLSMGDYSTNVAMALAKKEKINLKEFADKIVDELNKNKNENIKEIKAVNGFINFYLSKEFFAESIKEIISNKNFAKNDLYKGKYVMIEYTQPNPFKPFHIGHLMSNAIGESISRLLKVSGADVVRANYQGDVGPHVAKAIYGLKKIGMPSDLLSTLIKAEYIGECYSKGSSLYETDENAKKEIDEINKKIYDKSDPKINEIYEWGRKVTLEAFEIIYKTLGTKFDKYYFESVMAEIGQKIVERNEKGIFEKSDGAIVFHAEKYDPKLHTRVFINSQGLPTYETKELGLTATKFKSGIFSKKLDLSIVTTAVEQAEYMKVVSKVISVLNPSLDGKMKHITHGMMRFATGKMSSRTGNVITGESLIKDSKNEIKEKIKDRDFTVEEKESISSVVGIAALKYSILKQAIGGDIIYDFEKSISFEGDSGPYLQYSYTRAKSILNKAKKEGIRKENILPEKWETTEVEKIIYKFREVLERAVKDFEPHHIANYLIELAQSFNAFYASTQIVKKDDPTSFYKVALTEAVSVVMKDGLYLLGIEVPEKM